ncbi:hypothetical protein ASPZODRAFT_130026 [Penicilliopsis zonata CBS 506.65]|uniref:Zn(2)-C6 fungal-type domain-containing protein n=1 Tax=Penicilliopsis zonata CBS 506.65 TaxID=1073090 RepID=A0A1L9SM21_9EURO|nr:hypothetical protein ASPZODRAFT_130026 [Penicilliopsis zonata CBS 506.65]OJJ48097.1 hypothetical protein ASPZODRAFT_130026 [Penicilliopsis zonata CBS 506.65]
MARSLYSPEEEAGVDQPLKSDAYFPMTQTLSKAQQDTAATRGSGLIGSAADSEARNRTLSTRRRIQVACNRCRKRKIKCSGDSGDGQGCSNCRSAGNPDCQFLRVNSAVLQTKAGCNGWPYPTVNVTAAAYASSRMAAYNASPKPSMLSIDSPSQRVACFSRGQSYDLGSFDPHAFNRHSPGVDSSISYEEDPSLAYTIPATPCIPAGGVPSGLLADCCGSTWNPRGWSPAMSVSKGSNGVLYSEQDAVAALTQPVFSYVPTGLHDTPTLFPTVTSVPFDAQGNDRALPSPPLSRSPLGGGFSIFESGLPVLEEGRVGNQWATKGGGVAANCRVPVQTIPNGALLLSSPILRTKMTSPSVPDVMFDFLAMTPSSASPRAQIPSTAFAATVDPPFDSPDGLQPVPKEKRRKGPKTPIERSLSFSNRKPDMYNYSSVEKTKGLDSEASTLVNGLVYTRVRPTNLTSLSHSQPAPLAEYSPIRPSITSHGPSGY